MKETLRELLAKRFKPMPVPGQLPLEGNATPAAVLVPIFLKGESYHILFTKRTENVQKHRGEISFPGGAFETKDGSLINTALRESNEEIGLNSSDIEVLGPLGDTPTMVSGYVISPYIGVILYPHELHLDPYETQEVFEAPVLDLMDKNCFREEIRVRDGKPSPVYYYNYGERVIWGATAKILKQFLSVFEEAMAQERVKGLPAPSNR